MRRFDLEKLQAPIRLKNPTSDQFQSADGLIRWISQMFPTMRPVLAALYAICGNKNVFSKKWQEISGCELKIWGLLLGIPRFPTPRSLIGYRVEIEIYTDARASAVRKGVYKLGIGDRHRMRNSRKR